MEKMDPYFSQRLAAAKRHKVVREIVVDNKSSQEVLPNKELPNPTIEGTVEEFGWSEKAVDNFIDAEKNGKIRVEYSGGDEIKIEFLPLKNLPAVFGHVSELSNVQKNLSGGDVFGSKSANEFTYLQTTDFAVEGYMDDEADGKEYGRIYFDTEILSQKRNIYLDPESLNETDYEYGYSFCVLGGIPFEAIKKVEVIKAKSNLGNNDFDADDWPEDPEAEIQKQINRLLEYLVSKKSD